jgi:hypothetical protein
VARKSLIYNEKFRKISVWTPALIAVMYLTFFIFGDRKELNWSAWVWQTNRGLIIIVSILCLIKLHSARCRDVLAHLMLWYGSTAATSYYLSADRDGVFWGEMIRIVLFSILIWFLIIQSALALRAEEIEEAIAKPLDEIEV